MSTDEPTADSTEETERPPDRDELTEDPTAVADETPVETGADTDALASLLGDLVVGR